jgi:hypothetical protein
MGLLRKKTVPLLIHSVIRTPGPPSTASLMEELSSEVLKKPGNVFLAWAFAAASAALIFDWD